MKIDEIGDWSIAKLAILRAYLSKYTVILAGQTYASKPRFNFGYIDGFAGAGIHIDKTTKKIVQGSPLCALEAIPPFHEYHFIDKDSERIENLRRLAGMNDKVNFYSGDASETLLHRVLPRFEYKQYRRALCFLDPYGMSLDWKVLEMAGRMRSIEIFLNFPIMDINRNVKRSQATRENEARFTKFWGDETWRFAFYRKSPQRSLFEETEIERSGNEDIAEVFRLRLVQSAGFEFVPTPVAMRNVQGAVVYYLYFAGNNRTGSAIAKHIFDVYRRLGSNVRNLT